MIPLSIHVLYQFIFHTCHLFYWLLAVFACSWWWMSNADIRTEFLKKIRSVHAGSVVFVVPLALAQRRILEAAAALSRCQ